MSFEAIAPSIGILRGETALIGGGFTSLSNERARHRMFDGLLCAPRRPAYLSTFPVKEEEAKRTHEEEVGRRYKE